MMMEIELHEMDAEKTVSKNIEDVLTICVSGVQHHQESLVMKISNVMEYLMDDELMHEIHDELMGEIQKWYINDTLR